MQEPDNYKIPAYKRKRSISAKAKKTTNYRPLKKTGKKTKQIEVEDIPGISFLPPEAHFESNSKAPSTREMKKCGICEGYFNKIDVAIIKLTAPLKKGDKILFETDDGLFEQKVNSMQINRKDVALGRTGTEIGTKVKKEPKVGGTVYKVSN